MKKAAAFLFIIVFISACSIVGVHFKLHNPNRAGKYPEPTRERTLLGDQDSKYRKCFNVYEYDLEITFPTLEKDAVIFGRVTTSAIVEVESDTFQFDIGGSLIADSIYGNYDNGETYTSPWHKLDYKRVGNTIYVIYSDKVDVGDQITVQMYYHGCPPEAKRAPWKGGFVRKMDNLKNPWWGVACQSEGASLWWPCKDVVNDEPDRVRVICHVPKGFYAISNGMGGKLEADESLYEGFVADTGLSTFVWHVNYPINLYNITFYIGKYKLLHDTYTSKVTGDTLALNHYVLEQDYDKAKEHFKQLKDHLAFYEEVFGPYPFYKDGFKLVQSPYAGMEHQTAIAYGNKFKNNYLGFDYIILHETAHEWWGNSVTAEDLAEAWIHEGFATYAECLYVERTKGQKAYLDYLRTYKWTIINRRPVVGVYGLRYFNYKDGDIYVKGAWILHTLRQTINNDSVFFDIIKTFATRYMYKNVTSSDFQLMVNEKTGSDYTWFFDQYLYNRFVPELEYYESHGKVYYRYNPEYTNSTFRLPIALSDTAETKVDTIIPAIRISTTNAPQGPAFYWHTGVLVKFTENKKLKKMYYKQTKVGVAF